jgi:hypothetical protein
MLAFSLDNLLFLLLIAVAALFQLLSKVSKAGKSDSNETSSTPKPQAPRPIQRAPRESDADRIRKFLEALGQPPSSTPPSPVLPRTDIPPRALAPVQPPPVIMPRAWRLPREEREKSDVSRKENAPLEQPSRLQQVIPPSVPPPPAFQVHAALPPDVQEPQTVETSATASQATDQRPDFKMDIATLLASKSSLRQAILLREIIGTPRGLQALDLA